MHSHMTGPNDNNAQQLNFYCVYPRSKLTLLITLISFASVALCSGYIVSIDYWTKQWLHIYVCKSYILMNENARYNI